MATSGKLFLKDENALHIIEQGQTTAIHYYRKSYNPETYEEYPDNDRYDFSIPYKIEQFENQKMTAVTTNKNGKQYHLILKDEKPFDGVKFSYDKMYTYKNGKKNGAFKTKNQSGNYVQDLSLIHI